MSKYLSLAVLLFFIFAITSCSTKKPLKSDPELEYPIGDVNYNGVPFEIADAVLFSDFFLYGSSIFTEDRTTQIRATDVNGDGVTLTLGDLVYLTKIVNGDAKPVPKQTQTVPVQFYLSQGNSGMFSIRDNTAIGAVLVVLPGQPTFSVIANGAEMKYYFDGTDTRVLIWSPVGNSFSENIINMSVPPRSIQIATADGNPVNLVVYVPEVLYVHQNEPNPFTTETTLRFALAYNTNGHIVITNEAGEIVFDYSQFFAAGETRFTWLAVDQTGRNLPGGTYFCTISINGFSQTIEMNHIGPRF